MSGKIVDDLVAYILKIVPEAVTLDFDKVLKELTVSVESRRHLWLKFLVDNKCPKEFMGMTICLAETEATAELFERASFRSWDRAAEKLKRN